MDLKDETIPYEILIRFGEDGAFKGAHQQRRRVVTLGAERLKDEVLPAEPLDPSGFASVMGEAAARALAEGTAALAECERLRRVVAALTLAETERVVSGG